MSPLEWHRVKTLLNETLQRAPAQRAAFLDQVCADAPALREELETLLAAHAKANALNALESPFVGNGSDGVPVEPEALDQHLGAYRLVRLLGQGGMGAVYLAERDDDQFQHTVAIKLIRHGFDTSAARARFIFERQLLARMEHPHIARLYDGGLTEDKRPYFAMEYVEGTALTDYVESRKLSIEARLRLVLQVCDAVAYAHHQLIIHRDLKPSNVLVTEDEAGRPRAKLLDFGIAKLLDEEEFSGHGLPLTRTGARPMTPSYAAPEQLTGAAVTPATDVYALGLLLYEVLTGQPAYDLSHKTAAETERLVCTVTPKLPSSVAAREKDRRHLRGDLDQIALKALKKEPERRYASAQALGDDLRRFLGKMPVHARPDALAYRLRKFVERHRTGVLVAASVATLMVTLVTAFTLRLTRERDRAEVAAQEAMSQAERAEAVAGFLEQILRAPNARWYIENETKGPETPIRAVLDEAAAWLEDDFGDQPDLRADLHHIIGDTYLAMGLSDKALQHHHTVLDLRRKIYEPPHPKLAEALYYVAVMEEDITNRLRLLHQAVAMQREHNEGNNFPFMLSDLVGILIHTSAIDKADSLNREAIDFVDPVFVPGHDGFRYRSTLLSHLFWRRAEIHLRQARMREARMWMTRSDSVFQNNTAGLAFRTCTWGQVLTHEQRYVEAEQALLACRARDAFRGDAFRGYEFRSASYLIDLYEAWGRPADAIPYRNDARRHQQHLDHIQTSYLQWLATTDTLE